GLDYYTGPVFEIYLGDVSISIAAGGRYDELIQLYGGDPTPATGISLGVERIIATLQELGVLDDLRIGTEVFVASASDSVRDKAIEIAQRLRRAGISTDLDLMGRSLSKQLEYANRRGFRKVVIVGSRELEQGGVTVRDMETGEQRFIPLESLLDHLGAR
ncbi:MAG TPA: histidine--tRNA ligase, partial [Candidatus Bathyarchaeota archaeon]|nr:histidine--tRNA ligase [Candidatus Bathyarchaeota archaeon]